MKTTPFLEYVLYDIFGENEPVTFRPMMGAHVRYYNGKAFAIVENEELYFKGSKDVEEWYSARGSRRFSYKKEGEDAHLYYYLVSPEIYENKAVLEEWLTVALSVAKLPKKKKKKS